MKLLSTILLVLPFADWAQASSVPDWENPAVIGINKPYRYGFILESTP